jgi:hypothetical protein
MYTQQPEPTTAQQNAVGFGITGALPGPVAPHFNFKQGGAPAWNTVLGADPYDADADDKNRNGGK